MLPIVCFVGRSNSGKTTLLEKIIARLSALGYRVGTIKHDVHGFDIDREGKDSWRHRRAGAKTVVISSPEKAAMIKGVETELDLDRIVFEFMHDVDIVLTEGYKGSRYPKIEVIRGVDKPEPITPDRDTLIAIASDQKIDIGIPCFDINDADGITDFIQGQFLNKKGEREVLLMVDNRLVQLKPFIRDFLADSIKGMINSLKGCKNPGKIEIKID